MRRNRKGQFVSNAKKAKSRKRKATRRSGGLSLSVRRPSRVTIRNPRRRTRRKSARRSGGMAFSVRRPSRVVIRNRRRYRRNPNILSSFGLNTPMIKTVGFTVVGVAGTPFLEGFINPFIPATWKTSRVTAYAVKIASALGVGFVVKQLFGGEAAKAATAGGLAYVGVGAIREFAPGLIGSGTGTTTQKYLSSQPNLGLYPGLGSYMTADTPDRLRPETRY